ncbi:MAG: putative zinc transporter msc2 [Bathelium mastoideum]|nr:MAG: putative zinc transporter msc2 [Bathelium mastoideum]
MATSYALPPRDRSRFLGGNGYALHGHGHQRSRTGYLAPPSAVPSVPANGVTIKKNKSLGDLDVIKQESPIPTPPGSATSTFEPRTTHVKTIPDNEDVPEDEMKSRRPRGISDLGRPLSATELARTPASWTRIFSLPESLTALLVPLPFILGSAASLVSTSSEEELAPLSIYARLSLAFSGLDGVQHNSSPFSGLLSAAVLATGILLLSGAIARRNAPESIMDRRKSRHNREGSVGDVITSLSTLAPVADVFSRIFSLLLPLFAAFKLGGVQIGLTLLAMVTVGSTNVGVQQASTLRERRRILFKNKYTVCALAVNLLYDSWIARLANAPSLFLGYIALALSLVVFQLPLPSSRSALSITGLGASSESGNPMTWIAPTMTSKLTMSTHDANMTLAAALILLVPTAFSVFVSYPISAWTLSSAQILILLAVLSGIALVFSAEATSIRSRGRPSFTIIALAALFFSAFRARSAEGLLAAFLPGFLMIAVEYDRFLRLSKPRGHEHDHGHSNHSHRSHSLLTAFLLKRCNEHGVLHGILSEKDSRRILYFTTLNFSFMLVQAFYGFATGSLGLLSDTVHMFFDCLGLLVGLFAAVASKWPSTPDKPYGWGKLNTLSGFGNGVFLCLVSVEFVFEAISEYAEGEQLRRIDELLTVSTLGFLVNMVGLFAFGHAHHGHDHGHDHGHGHAHAHSSTPPTPFPPTPFSAENPEPSPSLPKVLAQHSHDHSHSNENMIGIWLHVLADALGSVAVIISTLLTKFYPWSGWDPLATLIIAILIFGSAVPLVISSGKNMLLSLPADVEYGIRNTLQELSGLRGVVGYNVPRFWIEDAETSHEHGHVHHEHHHHHHHDHHHGHHHGHDHNHGHGHKHSHDFHEHEHDHGHNHENDNVLTLAGEKRVLGVIHIVAAKIADLEDVRERVEQFLKSRRMNVVVHVERDGEGRCWCGSGEKRA